MYIFFKFIILHFFSTVSGRNLESSKNFFHFRKWNFFHFMLKKLLFCFVGEPLRFFIFSCFNFFLFSFRQTFLLLIAFVHFTVSSLFVRYFVFVLLPWKLWIWESVFYSQAVFILHSFGTTWFCQGFT